MSTLVAVVAVLLFGVVAWRVVAAERTHGSTTVSSPKSGPVSIEWFSEVEAEVIGTVVTHEKGCEIDLDCYLVLEDEMTRVEVFYHLGEGEACPNVEASEAGSRVELGQVVRARGAYSTTAAGHAINTCPDSSFFIAIQPQESGTKSLSK